MGENATSSSEQDLTPTETALWKIGCWVVGPLILFWVVLSSLLPVLVFTLKDRLSEEMGESCWAVMQYAIPCLSFSVAFTVLYILLVTLAFPRVLLTRSGRLPVKESDAKSRLYMRLVGLVLLGVIIAGAVCLSGCRPAAKPLGVIEIDHRARMIACADSIPLAPCRIEDKGRVIEFKKAEPGPPAEVSWANVNELLQTLAAMGLSFDDQVEVLRRLVRSEKLRAVLREDGDEGSSLMDTKTHFELMQKSITILEGDSAEKVLSLLGEPHTREETRWIYRWHGVSELGIREENSVITIEMASGRVVSVGHDSQSISRSARF